MFQPTTTIYYEIYPTDGSSEPIRCSGAENACTTAYEWSKDEPEREFVIKSIMIVTREEYIYKNGKLKP